MLGLLMFFLPNNLRLKCRKSEESLVQAFDIPDKISGTFLDELLYCLPPKVSPELAFTYQ